MCLRFFVIAFLTLNLTLSLTLSLNLNPMNRRFGHEDLEDYDYDYEKIRKNVRYARR